MCHSLSLIRIFVNQIPAIFASDTEVALARAHADAVVAVLFGDVDVAKAADIYSKARAAKRDLLAPKLRLKRARSICVGAFEIICGDELHAVFANDEF